MVNDRIADSIFNSSKRMMNFNSRYDELEWGYLSDAAAAIVGERHGLALTQPMTVQF